MAMGVLLLRWHLYCLVHCLCKFSIRFRKLLRYLDEISINFAWKSIFFQTVICYSDPGSHPFISREEREYLESELGQLKRQNNLPPTPWIKILTSIPMIALVCAQVKWWNALHFGIFGLLIRSSFCLFVDRSRLGLLYYGERFAQIYERSVAIPDQG